MNQWQGRTAFISGGASGIGLALGKTFAGAGMRIVLADIDSAELERVAGEIPAADLLCVHLDVTNRESWARAKAQAYEKFGVVDLLCNNAGIGPDGRVLVDVSPESFDRVIAVNLTGVFNGIATFGADMKARGAGHILNTASMAGLMASARLGPYTAAKFAVVGMSEVLRAEMAPHGIGVTVFCPGLVRTRLETTTRALGNEAIGSSMENAMDAMDAAQCAYRAICDNRLYALTHLEYWPHVLKRVELLKESFEQN